MPKKNEETKKYFIGCTLGQYGSGRARRVASFLGTTFGIRNVFKKYDPHMTWKAPFNATEEQVEELKKTLELFVAGRKRIKTNIGGFGHFSRGVVYLDVIPADNSDALELVQKELCLKLEEFDWMTFEAIEPSGMFHVTVGLDDVKARFSAIYDALQAEFGTKKVLESVASVDLFVKKDKTWVVEKSFPLA